MITTQDKEWSICYDGSSDRCKAPVCCTVIANPQPLVFSVSDHEDLAKYGSEQHAKKLKKEMVELKQIKSDLTITSIHTDNENTMKSMRKKYFSEYSIPGCGSHATQTILGMFSYIRAVCAKLVAIQQKVFSVLLAYIVTREWFWICPKRPGILAFM